MVHITVIGGTGFIGSRIVVEASARGHVLTSLSRTPPLTPAPAVAYVADDIQDASVLRRLVRNANVVVSALSPRAGMEGNTAPVLRYVARHARMSGTRLVVVGGAPTGLTGEPTRESLEMEEVFHDLLRTPESLDWSYVTPPSRLAADQWFSLDRPGHSLWSVEALAAEVVDEIEYPAHRRARFTVDAGGIHSRA